MNDITMELQTEMTTLCANFVTLRNECEAIYNCYFKSGASTWVVAKAAGAAVTVNTKLAKEQMVNGINFCDQVVKFFGNLALTQGDYLATIENLRTGTTTGATAVPTSVEQIGTRLLAVAEASVNYYNSAKQIESIYNSSSIAAAFSGLSDSIVVFGAEMTKLEMTSGIFCLQQWQKLLGNLAVTQGDYQTSVARFFRF